MTTGLHIEKDDVLGFPRSRHWWTSAVVFVVAAASADIVFNSGTSWWEMLSGPEASSGVTISANGVVVDVSWLSLVVNRLISDMSIGIAAVLLVGNLYKRWLWRYDRLLSVPVLDSAYQGVIEYPGPKGEARRKECSIRIDQQIDVVQMSLYTSETQSTTLIGRFVEECGEPVLYYVYRVKNLGFDNRGDSKLGAATLFLDVNKTLEGVYWTSDGRSGKLYFRKNSSGRSRDCAEDFVTAETGSRRIKHSCASMASDTTNEKLIRLFDQIALQAVDDFSGIGIIVYDKQFDRDRCKSLRPQEAFSLNVNIYEEASIDVLLSHCRKSFKGHDGFILVDAEGNVKGESQYLFPPFPSELIPDFHRGTRSYSALCGSSLEGIKVIGIMSEDKSYAVYCEGRCVFDSKITGFE